MSYGMLDPSTLGILWDKNMGYSFKNILEVWYYGTSINIVKDEASDTTIFEMRKKYSWNIFENTEVKIEPMLSIPIPNATMDKLLVTGNGIEDLVKYIDAYKNSLDINACCGIMEKALSKKV
jgi:hypothetical protein